MGNHVRQFFLPAWQVGEHEELLQKKGRYYELYMTQFAENQI